MPDLILRRNVHRNAPHAWLYGAGSGPILECRARFTFRVRWCPDSAVVAGWASSVEPSACRGFPALRRNLHRTDSLETVGTVGTETQGSQSGWVCQTCRRPLVIPWFTPPMCPDHPEAAVVEAA